MTHTCGATPGDTTTEATLCTPFAHATGPASSFDAAHAKVSGDVGHPVPMKRVVSNVVKGEHVETVNTPPRAPSDTSTASPGPLDIVCPEHEAPAAPGVIPYSNASTPVAARPYDARSSTAVAAAAHGDDGNDVGVLVVVCVGDNETARASATNAKRLKRRALLPDCLRHG